MKAVTKTTQRMARQAFGLLLELRTRDNAQQLLGQAIAFLEMLAREKHVDRTHLMISVRAVQLRKT